MTYARYGTILRHSMVAERIKGIRREAGMTKRELAAASGLSFATIESIELGRRVPSLATLGKIALALGIPTRDLLEDESPTAA